MKYKIFLIFLLSISSSIFSPENEIINLMSKVASRNFSSLEIKNYYNKSRLLVVSYSSLDTVYNKVNTPTRTTYISLESFGVLINNLIKSAKDKDENNFLIYIQILNELFENSWHNLLK